MIDIWSVPVPETHVWAIFGAWIGAYIAGRVIVGGRAL